MSIVDYKLIFHPEAETDYNDVYYWYELQKEGLGERFLKQARKRLEQILEKPETYGAKSRSSYREVN